MPIGKVKFYNNNKAYGFIIDEYSKDEIFVHITGLIDRICNGDLVNFDITEGNKGLMAVNVILISKSE